MRPLIVRRRDDAPIMVPNRVRTRARRALALGSPSTWIDQTLYLIGSNTTHHRPGDALLDEAVQSAQALLALLVEMQEAEIRDREGL